MFKLINIFTGLLFIFFKPLLSVMNGMEKRSSLIAPIPLSPYSLYGPHHPYMPYAARRAFYGFGYHPYY